MKNNMKYFALIAIGYVFLVFTANLNAQEDIIQIIIRISGN